MKTTKMLLLALAACACGAASADCGKDAAKTKDRGLVVCAHPDEFHSDGRYAVPDEVKSEGTVPAGLRSADLSAGCALEL